MNYQNLTMPELDRIVRASPRFEHAHLHDPTNRYMARLVALLQPKLTVELGTGDGVTAAQIAAAMPEASAFVTVNWPNPPSGDNVGIFLRRFLDDIAPNMRLFQQHMSREMFVRHYGWDEARSRKVTQLYGETCDEWILKDMPDGIELLYIDSTHTCAQAAKEWLLWAPKLADEAIVVVDDLSHNDMRVFWGALAYDKVDGVLGGDAGMLRYRKDSMKQNIDWVL